MDIAPEPRRSPQRELHELLQAELLHTLGAYGVVTQRLERLRRGLEDRQTRDTNWEGQLGEVVDQALECNQRLRSLALKPASMRKNETSRLLHADATAPPRHPHPGRGHLEMPTKQWVVDYYATAVTSLRVAGKVITNADPEHSAEQRLGELLRQVNDPQRRGVSPLGRHLIDGRIDRNHTRRSEAEGVMRTRGQDLRAQAILDDYLGASREDALHLHVIDAFGQAHMGMHRVENYMSHAYGDALRHQRKISSAVTKELRRSLVLNTFVYAVSRSVPWIFAEDERERDHVRENHRDCGDRLTPTFCMWIGLEMSMLALHRRAYTFWLMGQPGRAYRDFHKLIRLLRTARPQIEQRATRVPGARTFLEGMSAIAEHHIGRIYRNQHAHRVALRYFRRADKRLTPWSSDPDIGPILRNSRWRVHLLASQGKTYYELGQIKLCLLAYLKAWRAFLELAASESQARPNFAVVDELIEWLSIVQIDPEVNKLELRDRVDPLVKQFETVFSPNHLMLLASDLMMRFGHVLYILKLPAPTLMHSDVARLRRNGHKIDHSPALRCMLQAARLDDSSTLIASDLQKIANAPELSGQAAKAATDSVAAALDSMVPLGAQWPAGGGRFEESARVIEYVLQRAMAENATSSDQLDDRGEIAIDLMKAFLVHTDSSNVKLAQVYRYLMQRSHALRLHEAGPQSLVAGENYIPVLDLVCLRRYSSFFPFLPRPSTFQAPGGGYFVRVHDPHPFGIAVDPGPNFLDNLYRCGYCLADVHMIVVTHDHADHLTSLDALLALMGYREFMGAGTFSQDRKLLIVGNPSVVERYSFFNEAPPMQTEKELANPDQRGKRRDAVRVITFDEAQALTRKRVAGDEGTDSAYPVLLDAQTLLIEPVETFDHRDAHGYIAQGFRLCVGAGRYRSSILFTSDTGPLPKDDGRDRLCSTGVPLAEAVQEAQVVVAHLSSVPLRELRDMANLDDAVTGHPLSAEFQELWHAARDQAREGEVTSPHDPGPSEGPSEFLLRQLQFGFRIRPKAGGRAALDVSPLSPIGDMLAESEKHLYLSGILDLAQLMRGSGSSRLLLVGELREELGTFRTRVASAINTRVFNNSKVRALTADIGLKVRVQGGRVNALCTTCDLDNDLVDLERFHPAKDIIEVCVKGENEAIFYNCPSHDPQAQPEPLWLEAVERYDPFSL